jgi:hypothetical protein
MEWLSGCFGCHQRPPGELSKDSRVPCVVLDVFNELPELPLDLFFSNIVVVGVFCMQQQKGNCEIPS